jgi:hypothetical protein
VEGSLNKHDLSRRIPADVRRALRQEAGFGCVKCGFAFCEYEHIDPEFADATDHDVTKMAFLCKRCHGEVTAGISSKDSVWAAKSGAFLQAPEAGVEGQSRVRQSELVTRQHDVLRLRESSARAWRRPAHD